MIAKFGKFILVLSLCLQGSLLIQGVNSGKNFEENLKALALNVPQTLDFLTSLYDYFHIIRYVLASLYFSSILLLVSSCWCIPLLTSTGIIVYTALLTVPTLAKDPQDMTATITILKNLSIVGGLIYLMGCNACNKKATACTPKAKTE